MTYISGQEAYVSPTVSAPAFHLNTVVPSEQVAVSREVISPVREQLVLTELMSSETVK